MRLLRYVGLWLVTPDEMPDPQDLDLWLEVDGHRLQGHTRMMIFNVACKTGAYFIAAAWAGE